MIDPSPVLLLYNTPSTETLDDGRTVFRESESGVMQEVQAVSTALDKVGIPYKAIGIRNLRELPQALYRNPSHVVINLVEGFQTNPDEMTLIPAVCRSFGMEVTGSDSACLALTLDKWRTIGVLKASGLPCPEGILVPKGQTVPKGALPHGKCIVKPAASDASEGIDTHSIADSQDPILDALVHQVHHSFNQAALVEQMVGQRELNVSLLQTGNNVSVLPIAEIDFSAFGPDHPRIVGYTAKWLSDTFEFNHTPRLIPAPISPEQAEEIKRICLKAWDAAGCRDYARVDIRLDEKLGPFILEINPNPDISPDAGFAAALQAAGIPYETFVQTLVHNAAERLPPIMTSDHFNRRRVTGESTPNRRIRYVMPSDRDAVVAMLTQPTFFRPDEIKIAEEVLDESIKAGSTGHYQSFVLEEAGVVNGWVCFGPTPCTMETYDIYWLAVASNRQRGGFGKSLMEFAEARIRERGGRLAIIETSGRDDYIPTRRFYANVGYIEAARVHDFYAPGDDKIISLKTL